jgi:hypothetical protein
MRLTIIIHTYIYIDNKEREKRLDTTTNTISPSRDTIQGCVGRTT